MNRYTETFSNGDGWGFQLVELPSVGRVQLWYCIPGGQRWELGHGKAIPTGLTASAVGRIMRQWVLGRIDHDAYNKALPD